MIHKMNLNQSPYQMIENGEKTIELRLNDDRRKHIKIGDYIIFTNNTNKETIIVEVLDVYKFNNFKELYENLDIEQCGYKKAEVHDAKPEDMLFYYSEEQQLKYGVVGIQIKPLQLNEKSFNFKEINFLTDNEIDLVIDEKMPANIQKKYVPAYKYDIFLHQSKTKIGFIDIRIGYTEGILYGGNIGYTIYEEFRGHRYAQKACQLIFKVAIAHHMDKLFITCNPSNLASKKTCENLELKLLGIIELPSDNERYLEGDRERCIFEWSQ